MRKLKNIFLIYFLLFSITFAHKINAFYDIEDGKIIISSYFSDGKPTKNAKVKIIDESNGKVVIKGKTNEKGEFICKLLPPSNYKVIVEGELGHRAVTEILKEDILDSLEENISENQNNLSNMNKFNITKIKSNMSNNSKENVYSKSFNINIITNNQNVILQKLSKLEEDLKKVKLQNKYIKRKFLELEENLSKPNLINILGGIGWILGIFGGIALVACKRK